MKIFFANYRSGTGISIRAAINALLNWPKAERAQTAARKKTCHKSRRDGIIGPESQFGDTRLLTRRERKLSRP
jgi:hypothetical protein